MSPFEARTQLLLLICDTTCECVLQTTTTTTNNKSCNMRMFFVFARVFVLPRFPPNISTRSLKVPGRDHAHRARKGGEARGAAKHLQPSSLFFVGARVEGRGRDGGNYESDRQRGHGRSSGCLTIADHPEQEKWCNYCCWGI